MPPRLNVRTLAFALSLLSTPLPVLAQNRPSGDPLAAVTALYDPAVTSVSALSLDTTSPTTVTSQQGSFRESPFTRFRVTSGDLPSLANRLPPDPAVVDTGGGTHGGTISLQWQGPHASPYLYNAALDKLIRPATDNRALITFQESGDSSYAANIIEGVKWSDGAAFTVDDVQYFYENVLQIAMPEPWASVSFQKINDHRFILTFDQSRYDMNAIYDIPWYFPKHYHEYIPNKEDAFSTYYANNNTRVEEWTILYYEWISRLDDPPPTLAPWMLDTIAADHVIALRNPYYWAVDNAGNQLPYADRLLLYDTSTSLVDEGPRVGDKLIPRDNNVVAWERYPAFLTLNKGAKVDTLSKDHVYTVRDAKVVRSFASSELYLLMSSRYGTCAARDCWVLYGPVDAEIDANLLPPAAVVSGVVD